MSKRSRPNQPRIQWINFYPRIDQPDWVRVLLDKEDPSNFIFSKLTDEAYCEFAWWFILDVVDTPAALEEWHDAFKDYVSQYPEVYAEFTRVYKDMWTYFTGNVEAAARGEV